MPDSEQETSEVEAAFNELVSVLHLRASSNRYFPLQTPAAMEVLAFDLQQRHELAILRAALRSDEGQSVVEALEAKARERGEVRPMGNQPKPEPKTKETTQPKRKKKTAKQRAAKPDKKKAERPVAKDAQQKLAEKLRRVKSNK